MKNNYKMIPTLLTALLLTNAYASSKIDPEITKICRGYNPESLKRIAATAGAAGISFGAGLVLFMKNNASLSKAELGENLDRFNFTGENDADVMAAHYHHEAELMRSFKPSDAQLAQNFDLTTVAGRKLALETLSQLENKSYPTSSLTALKKQYQNQPEAIDFLNVQNQSRLDVLKDLSRGNQKTYTLSEILQNGATQFEEMGKISSEYSSTNYIFVKYGDLGKTFDPNFHDFELSDDSKKIYKAYQHHAKVAVKDPSIEVTVYQEEFAFRQSVSKDFLRAKQDPQFLDLERQLKAAGLAPEQKLLLEQKMNSLLASIERSVTSDLKRSNALYDDWDMNFKMAEEPPTKIKASQYEIAKAGQANRDELFSRAYTTPPGEQMEVMKTSHGSALAELKNAKVPNATLAGLILVGAGIVIGGITYEKVESLPDKDYQMDLGKYSSSQDVAELKKGYDACVKKLTSDNEYFAAIAQSLEIMRKKRCATDQDPKK